MGEILDDLQERKARLLRQKAYLQDAVNQINLINQRITKINALITAILGIDT